MPSDAYEEYLKNLNDVHRLVLMHRHASSDTPGKRGLGHITRGGLLLLCAAWERYIESVVEEAAGFLTSRLPNCAALPANARQKAQDHANSNKTAWTAADVNTAAWTQIYLEAVQRRTHILNTPKYSNLKPLFEGFLDVSDIANAWTRGSAPIDAFVALRGEVAHRGGQSQYIRFGKLTDAEDEVSAYVDETDNFLSDHLRPLVNPHRRPWNRVL